MSGVPGRKMCFQGFQVDYLRKMSFIFHGTIPCKLTLGMCPGLFRRIPTRKITSAFHITRDLSGNDEANISFSQFVKGYCVVAAIGFIAHVAFAFRSEEHTSELQSRENLVCRLLLEKKNKKHY